MAEEANASDAAATPDVPKIDLSASLDNAMTNPKGKMPTGLAKRAGSAPKERPPPPQSHRATKKALPLPLSGANWNGSHDDAFEKTRREYALHCEGCEK